MSSKTKAEEIELLDQTGHAKAEQQKESDADPGIIGLIYMLLAAIMLAAMSLATKLVFRGTLVTPL